MYQVAAAVVVVGSSSSPSPNPQPCVIGGWRLGLAGLMCSIIGMDICRISIQAGL